MTCLKDHANRNSDRRRGLSLLEIIIATGIVAGSAVMLTSLFQTGDRHTSRAEERTFAQMLCQSKLDELMANPMELMSVQAEVFQHYPGWMWAVEVQESTIDGLVNVQVTVTRIPNMPTGADLAITATPSEQPGLPTIPRDLEPTFELTRWMRHEGAIQEADGADSSSSIHERLEARGRGRAK